MADLPLVMTATGLQPQSPASLRAAIIALVQSSNPDYTANLPASLVEDIVSTDVAACVVSDSFLVDLVNSITPNGANPFLLNLLGQLYGVPLGTPFNTSVYVKFGGMPAGYVVQSGFIVSDGSYQYLCQEGGIIDDNGTTLPILAIATVSGTWAVPTGTVTQFVTSVPSDVTLTVTNAEDGFPATQAESQTSYRQRVMAAGLAASTGATRLLKTYVSNVPGVQARLVSVQRDVQGGGWVVLVGGGDVYQVAYAIWQALFDTVDLIGPPIYIAGISNANPAVVTTATNHNLTTGNVERVDGCRAGMAFMNGQEYAVTVLTPKTFSIPVDTTGAGPFTYGGALTPNPIVSAPAIYDYPDTYVIPYIIPDQELVTLGVQWATNYPNYVSSAAVAAVAAPALAAYINSLPAGVTPINLANMTAVFLASVQNLLPPETVTVLTFTVSIDGFGAVPVPGTQVIPGDPHGYFYCTTANIAITQT